MQSVRGTHRRDSCGRAPTRNGTLVAIAILLGFAVASMAAAESIRGKVVGETGEPLAGATVRVRASTIEDRTDERGRFRLEGVVGAAPLRVTAWKADYYIVGKDARPGQRRLLLQLEPYPTEDHAGYAWMSPAKCDECHVDALYREWADSAHALGVDNPIFMTMYNGSDVLGNRGPPTRRRSHPDYGSLPLPPVPGEPYFGPGYTLDFADAAGNCAACHLPGAALDAPYGTDPNCVEGVDALGTHCDFCHKIVDVDLDPETGRPRPERPGVLSLRVVRPGPERQLFLGPYDDVDEGPDTFLPLMRRSEICAPCHDASFWGTPIYESFGEWLASAYAERGQTCQHCHMQPDGTTTNVAPGHGGVERHPARVPTHGCTGAADEALLRGAVLTDVSAERHGESIDVEIAITNHNTGHHVPTDSPLRQMILLVRAFDEGGAPLPLVEGPRLPSWCGEGDPAAGRYAGLPGVGFAKILRESWTGVSPTAAYWNPTRIVSDNRIAAFATDTSRYRFDAAQRGDVRLEVTLLFRRAFIDLMERKGWDAPDILMHHRTVHLDTPGRS